MKLQRCRILRYNFPILQVCVIDFLKGMCTFNRADSTVFSFSALHSSYKAAGTFSLTLGNRNMADWPLKGGEEPWNFMDALVESVDASVLTSGIT